MAMPVEQVYQEITMAVNRAINATAFFGEALERCAVNGVRVKGVDLVIEVEHWVARPQTSDEQFLRSMGIHVEQQDRQPVEAPLSSTVRSQQSPAPGRIVGTFRKLIRAFSISPDKS